MKKKYAKKMGGERKGKEEKFTAAEISTADLTRFWTASRMFSSRALKVRPVLYALFASSNLPAAS